MLIALFVLVRKMRRGLRNGLAIRMGRIYPFDAYDQAAARIEEKYAQHSRMRGGSEEVYPPGGEGERSRIEKAIVGAR